MRNQVAYIMNELSKLGIQSFIKGNRLRMFRGNRSMVEVFPYEKNPSLLSLEDSYSGVGMYGFSKKEILERIVFLIEFDE